jgi:hypothetical protein
MLPRQLVDLRGGWRCPLLDAGEDQILLGMMQHVGVMGHVEHDVEHQRVVRRAAGVELVELVFEQIEQPCEIDVLGMP